MPLLCISLLALLLLPLSLSCGSKRPPGEVQNDYMAIVQVELDNTNAVSTLHFLTCKMKKLGLSHSDGLAMSVLNSIRCPCPGKPTNGPNMMLKTAVRRRRNAQRKSKETKNLCKTKAILSTMTECYEKLNSLLMDT